MGEAQDMIESGILCSEGNGLAMYCSHCNPLTARQYRDRSNKKTANVKCVSLAEMRRLDRLKRMSNIERRKKPTCD